MARAPISTRPRTIISPGERIQAQPWAFVGLVLAAGLAAGWLLRYKRLRKGLLLYLGVSRLL